MLSSKRYLLAHAASSAHRCLSLKLWPGLQCVVDLGSETMFKGDKEFMRCVKYEENEETVGELHKVPYILHD